MRWDFTRLATLLVASSLLSLTLHAQSIRTVAGGGSDDGVPATDGALDYPVDVAVGSDGTIYIADFYNYRIRKVTPSGTLLTAVGDGSEANGGDNVPARSASMGTPSGVAVDAAGNIYYVDPGYDRVRKMTASSGLVTTIAGKPGNAGYSGDGGPAKDALLREPSRVAVDADGNVFISERGNHVIRRIDAAGRISTVAGNGAAGFSGDTAAATQAQLNSPTGIAVDSAGNLYIADTGNARVRRVDAATKKISTIAGTGSDDSTGDGGPATQAALNGPDGVAWRDDGSLFISERSGQRVRMIDPSGTIRTAAGTGSGGFGGDGRPATEARLASPSGIAVGPNGSLFITDTDNLRIRRVDKSTGTIDTVAGSDLRESSGDGGIGTNATLASPRYLTTDIAGNLYIAETLGYRVRKLQRGSGIISTIAGTGDGGSTSTGDDGPAVEAKLSPTGLAFDSSGNLYIGDKRDQKSIRKVVISTGTITTIAGGNGAGYAGDGGDARQAKLNEPAGMVIDASGFLYFADTLNHRVRRIELASNRIETYAGTGTGGYSGDDVDATQAQLNLPNGVALDSAGNLYIADTENHRIRRVDAATRKITTVAGSGLGSSGNIEFGGDGGPAVSAKLGRPRNLGFDALGNLFIGDAHNQRIRRVDSGGVITTISGNGINAFAGDGGPAKDATLADPRAIVFDDTGNLYFTDGDNNRVRAISGCVSVGGPSLVFPPNNATNVVVSPTLRWNTVDGAFRYDVYLDQGTASTLIAKDVGATSYSVGNLLPGKRYAWRVEAKGDPFCTPLSTFSSTTLAFTTATGCSAPGEFALSTPADNATSVDAGPLLSWQSATGASSYDLYLGITNPPPLSASTSATSLTASALAPGTSYSWYVAAHASCDATKIRTTAVRTFTTAGSCTPPATFSTLAPANGATVASGSVALSWERATGAAAWDLYLGTPADPPLYRANLPSPGLTVDGLLPSTAYSWRVVARSGCSTSTATTATARFTVGAECRAPAAPSILFSPPGNVQIGKSYVIVWQDTAAGAGKYLVERSADASFLTTLDSQSTAGNSASFVATAAGTYYHRVRAVAGCNSNVTSAPSSTATVTAVAAVPNVVFSVQPRSVVAQLGEKLETLAATFTVENIGGSAVQVLLGRQEIASVPFFSVIDPLSDGSPFVSLEPRKPRSFELRFSGPKADSEGTYQGIIFLASTTTPLPITPYAFVNLKVGGSTGAAPIFLAGGQPSGYVFFPGFAGDDTARPPVTVSIRNPGTTPLELGAEIGPELWLVPEPGWNATPLSAGSTREVRLTTQRSRAPSGSGLPRYTYFTVRARTGETARLLVQDNDSNRAAAARGADSNPSFIVPDVVSVDSSGTTLLTRVRLTNLGSEAVEASLFFTPVGSGGFDSSVKTAVVVVPPNDVVTLTDPAVQLFGLSRPARGQIEIRAEPRSIGFLTITASNATLTDPETALQDTPVLHRFEGLGLGANAMLGGIASDAATRSELVLAETSGTDGAKVRVALADSEGVERANRIYTLERYGSQRIDDVVGDLGTTVSGTASLRISVTNGGGTVASFARRIDRASRTGATIVPVELPPDAAAKQWDPADTPPNVTYTIPTVASGTSVTLATAIGLTAPPTRTVTITVVFLPDLGGRFEKSVTVSAGKTIEYSDVLRDLFSLVGSQQGTLQVTAPGDVHLYSITRAAPFAPGAPPATGSNPAIPAGSPGNSGAVPGALRPVYLDGLDQSVDPSRGNRWNVVLTEVQGGSATVTVSLYEAGNRSTPIATRDVTIGAKQRTKLESVFSSLGLDAEDRRKDRTNVLCLVKPKSGNGIVSVVAEVVNNLSGSSRTLAFSPVGGTGSVSLASPVSPQGRRRPVRRP